MSARCTKIAYLAKNQYPFVVCAYLVYARRFRIFPKKNPLPRIFSEIQQTLNICQCLLR